MEIYEYLRILYKWKWLSAGGPVLAAAVALVASLLLPPKYRSEVIIEIGKVWNNLLADSNELAAKVNSKSFQDKILNGRMNLDILPSKFGKWISAEILLTEKKEPLRYAKVTSFGPTPETAVKILENIVEELASAHKVYFDEWIKANEKYANDMQADIRAQEKDLGDMQATLANVTKAPKVDPPAVVLLQVNIDERLNSLQRLRKEHENVIQKNTLSMNSRNTRAVDPPLRPRKPFSPKPVMNAAAGFLAGLFLAFVAVPVLEYATIRRGGAGKK